MAGPFVTSHDLVNFQAQAAKKRCIWHLRPRMMFDDSISMSKHHVTFHVMGLIAVTRQEDQIKLT